MATEFESIGPALQKWIEAQHLFFVASAPLAEDGLVNCSPKGMDSLRILSPREVAYLDLTGSGAETIAHVRENRRIVFMFCAFDGPPKIVRLHGVGSVALPGSDDWRTLRGLFPPHPGARAIVRARLVRIADSCGYSVPHYHYAGERDGLVRWAVNKGDEGLAAYRAEKNVRSLDGLPAIDVP